MKNKAEKKRETFLSFSGAILFPVRIFSLLYSVIPWHILRIPLAQYGKLA